jgi:CRP-like cAMP-binding protein
MNASMNASTHEILQNNALVAELSTEQLLRILESGEIRSVGKDDIIISEARDSVNFYLVLDGELEVYHPGTPNKMTLAMCKPGDYVGEYAFIDGEPASATVMATRPSELFVISHDALRSVFKEDPDIGRLIYRNILANLVARLRKMDKDFDEFTLIF